MHLKHAKKPLTQNSDNLESRVNGAAFLKPKSERCVSSNNVSVMSSKVMVGESMKLQNPRKRLSQRNPPQTTKTKHRHNKTNKEETISVISRSRNGPNAKETRKEPHDD